MLDFLPLSDSEETLQVSPTSSVSSVLSSASSSAGDQPLSLVVSRKKSRRDEEQQPQQPPPVRHWKKFLKDQADHDRTTTAAAPPAAKRIKREEGPAEVVSALLSLGQEQTEFRVPSPRFQVPPPLPVFRPLPFSQTPLRPIPLAPAKVAPPPPPPQHVSPLRPLQTAQLANRPYSGHPLPWPHKQQQQPSPTLEPENLSAKDTLLLILP